MKKWALAALLSVGGLASPAQAAERHFVVDSKASELAYSVRAKLFLVIDEDIVGRNRNVEGAVRVDESLGASAWLSLDARAFQSGVKTRDKRVSEILETQKFPRIRFELDSLTGIDLSRTEGQGVASGFLTVRDRQVPLRIPIRYKLSGDRLELDGKIRTTFSSFGLAPPILGFVVKRAPDEILLEAKLVAKEVRAARAATSKLAGSAE